MKCTVPFREYKQLGHASVSVSSSSHHPPHQRRRNKVKRREAYYSRQRRADITVSQYLYIVETLNGLR